jgi:hypothetical protein
MRTRLVWTIKSSGIVKCRLVIRGDLDSRDFDYIETEAPTATQAGTRAFQATCAMFNFVPRSTDIKSAFTQSDDLDLSDPNKVIFAQYPKGW